MTHPFMYVTWRWESVSIMLPCLRFAVHSNASYWDSTHSHASDMAESCHELTQSYHELTESCHELTHSYASDMTHPFMYVTWQRGCPSIMLSCLRSTVRSYVTWLTPMGTWLTHMGTWPIHSCMWRVGESRRQVCCRAYESRYIQSRHIETWLIHSLTHPFMYVTCRWGNVSIMLPSLRVTVQSYRDMTIHMRHIETWPLHSCMSRDSESNRQLRSCVWGLLRIYTWHVLLIWGHNSFIRLCDEKAKVTFN